MQQSALARALFDEGVRRGDAGDWVGAADHFGRAYALRPTSNVAYNWASALIEVGQFLQAQELLASVQRDEAASPELRRACDDQLARLSPRIPHVRFEVDATREQELDVDGRSWPRPAWNVSSPLDPGDHVVRLRDGESELAQQSFTLRERETRTIALHAPVQLEHEEGSKRWWRSWPLWTAVGVVAAGAVVTAVVLATRKDGESRPVTGNATPGVLQW